MKFELKTENENYTKSISQFFGVVFFLTLIIILCDVALKLGILSRNHISNTTVDFYLLKNQNLILRNYLGFLIWKLNNKFGNFAGRLSNNN